ncbi:MAG: hypothetical protein EOP77_01990 [Variovorax sp.]|jgi:hypothetical protein|nr:MAG: hypothetical protein EOP77_01990 [Variovorax sp.]
MSAFEARLYFQSFYGEHENLRLKVTADVKEFEQIYLPVQQRKLIHAYSDARLCQADITCLKLEELLAQKLKALLMRRHSPDLFDFVHSVFFQKVLSISRLDILRTFYKLTVYENDPTVARDLLLALPFETIRGFWNQYLSCPKSSLFSFDDAAGWFKSIVADIFSLGAPHLAEAGAGAGASGGGGGGFWARRSHYFSSEHRDLMFEAGRLQRLLKVRYDGFDRLVEPYAMTFKKPKESAAREYFYVYDTTGGRDGKQSIKAFVADKLQAIESTEQEFEPRYPIELAKGGGYFGRPDFASSRPRAESFGRARRARAAPARGFGMTYKVQCPACGKIFSRSLVDTSLRAHKDKYGNDCYGRVGYLV